MLTLTRKSNEYIAPRHEISFLGVLYVVGSITHRWDTSTSYNQDIVGYLLQSPDTRNI